ncbi:DUF4169 family protein [Thioclava atlantica]|uniref:Uncharacterized protein n=1 Tax=Thioclava atlantica TaxID=1317124 RepID=A0A085TXI2_9RHOB|nr:DUF4169 family protein [Thioclava atlantica]KFE35429.1 hypothetical protein DW2_08367 [Thioclava atlantica]
MSNVTNLNRFRKQQARVKKRAQGNENAVKFGRSASQKRLEEARSEKAGRALEAHRREREE